MPKPRPVGPLIYRNYEFLNTVARSRSAHRRKSLLAQASSGELLSIVEVAHNLLALDRKSGKPHFNLTKHQRGKLIPSATIIRKIARSRSEHGARRHIQRGSGIGVLAPLLIPVLAEIARSLLKGGKKEESDGS
jgi:hypothetical protein